VVFLAPPAAPEAPLEVTEITKNSATLTWKESPEDGGSPITHYLLEMKEAWKSTWTYVEKKRAGEPLKHKLSHLTEGSEYVARVMAENKAGQSEVLESEKFTPKNQYGELPDFTKKKNLKQ